MGLGFTSQRDATNAGVGTVNALFMLGGEFTVERNVAKKCVYTVLSILSSSKAQC